ncbi:uncharacterized protein LOC126570055 [Anopheles aquasalis]|uniref:uncharacterized protein LOC126570055 n=1 Tax=Anopheles aquasalis TaxID=42839 RepID=UPI00215A3B8A|nr:uncharacterized protein LOC126570055 [Anopheles aquasalis]
MHHRSVFVAASLLLLVLVPLCNGLPLWNFLSGTEVSRDVADNAAGEIDLGDSQATADGRTIRILSYNTMVPALQMILTPIGRMVWPRVEQWFSDTFGSYLDSANRAIENIAQYATDNISFQTGDVYYTKSDMINGHGYQSLIVTLPSGRTVTILTFKSKNKFNVFEEFPQLTDAQNEVRKIE